MFFYAKKYNSIEGYDFKIHVYIHSHFHKHCYFKIYIPLLFPLKRCGQNKLQGKSLKGKYNSSCKSSQSLCFTFAQEKKGFVPQMWIVLTLTISIFNEKKKV